MMEEIIDSMKPRLNAYTLPLWLRHGGMFHILCCLITTLLLVIFVCLVPVYISVPVVFGSIYLLTRGEKNKNHGE